MSIYRKQKGFIQKFVILLELDYEKITNKNEIYHFSSRILQATNVRR